MLLTRAYYDLKPFLPFRLRLALRRLTAAAIRRRSMDVWPIKQNTCEPPRDWIGWPNGKQFALVLTHDVESKIGMEKCHLLAGLEKEHGFVSSFNFIPEGKYNVTPDLRRELKNKGFEIGVHDLKHDGKLYRSHRGFLQHARGINKYLHEWNASGFRSGFMLRNLEWLHALDIEYDMSTFDTDPFEPQPDGVETIFPFWVPAPASTYYNARKGYVEMPYTLTQDFTLFLSLKETNINIWTKKLEWIASRGGMVLLNVHPDYINFNGRSPRPSEYPVQFYKDFLTHLNDRYAGQFWNALPRQVAAFARNHYATTANAGFLGLTT